MPAAKLWVPALRSSARAMHRVRDTRLYLTPHPVGDSTKILRHDIPIALRLEIVFLQGAVFGRARNEGRLQTQLLGGLEILVVGGDHHHLLRRQAEQARSAEIGFGVGLV